MSEQDKCKPRPSPRPPKDHHKYFKTTPMPNMTNCLHLTTPQSIYSAYILTMKNINRHTDTHSSFVMKIVFLSYKTNIYLNIVHLVNNNATMKVIVQQIGGGRMGSRERKRGGSRKVQGCKGDEGGTLGSSTCLE